MPGFPCVNSRETRHHMSQCVRHPRMHEPTACEFMSHREGVLSRAESQRRQAVCGVALYGKAFVTAKFLNHAWFHPVANPAIPCIAL